MPAFRLSQNHGEAAAAEAEALRHRPSYPHLGTVAGYAVSLAVNPDLTCTIIYLIDAGTESPE
jgi:hypothetical protein